MKHNLLDVIFLLLLQLFVEWIPGKISLILLKNVKIGSVNICVIDVKTMRGTIDSLMEKSAIHVVSAWAS